MSLLPVELPEVGRTVTAIVKQFGRWKTEIAMMKRVDGDDHDWEFSGSIGELSNDYDVIYWEYVEEVK